MIRLKYLFAEATRDARVIVVGNKNGDPSKRLLTFHMTLVTKGKIYNQLFSLHLWANSRAN